MYARVFAENNFTNKLIPVFYRSVVIITDELARVGVIALPET